MRRLRVLSVEDDAVIGALLAEILAELGYEPCGNARTETEAVEAAGRHAPDLMIVDAYLGTGNGVSAMNTILRRTAMPHIFMTGGSRAIIPANANVLYKPFGTADLSAALDRAARQVVVLGEGWLIPNRDVFALDKMGLNPFLFAVIGTEADGSRLTVLSALARLGKDPWTTAASWAAMSSTAASEALSACIAQMPVGAKDLEAAPLTAARLVLLLSPPAAAPAGRRPRLGARQRTAATMLVTAAVAALLLGAALLASQSGILAPPPPVPVATRAP